MEVLHSVYFVRSIGCLPSGGKPSSTLGKAMCGVATGMAF